MQDQLTYTDCLEALLEKSVIQDSWHNMFQNVPFPKRDRALETFIGEMLQRAMIAEWADKHLEELICE